MDISLANELDVLLVEVLLRTSSRSVVMHLMFV